MTSFTQPDAADDVDWNLPSRPTSFELDVNGERHVLEADQDVPLLYILRSELGLLGSRFGCGAGLCGVCFVLVDGRPTASCQTRTGDVTESLITTIEGLTGDVGHPVQRALVEHQAAQCGYCISGIVVSAVALLERSDNPTASEVAQALEGNLCRCGSHNRIVRAVLAAAAVMRERSAAGWGAPT